MTYKKSNMTKFQRQTFNVYFSIVLLLAQDFVMADKENRLAGQHLIVSGLNSVVGYNIVRNASGHIIKIGGLAADMMAWLSTRYNFTYSVLQTNETLLDPSGHRIGLIGHLLKNHCQILFTVAATTSRIGILEFLHPNMYLPISYLIPEPVSSANVAAVTYSFQKMVWIWLLVSMFGIVSAFYFFLRFTGSASNENWQKRKKRSWLTVSSYMWSVLLNQGGYLPYKTIPFYLIGATWCIASFVLINAYNCTLMSHLTLPHKKPLIDSIYDLRDQPNLHLVTDQNLNVNSVLSTADSGFLKVLGDKLRSYSKSRCNTTRDCIKLVKSGSHVYTSGIKTVLYGAMKDDYQETGRCNLHLQQENYMSISLSFALAKNSRYMENLNFGIMQMQELGLLDKWIAKFQPNPRECLQKKTRHTVKNLTTSDLLGAFVILQFGMAFAISAFICEHTFYRKKISTLFCS